MMRTLNKSAVSKRSRLLVNSIMAGTMNSYVTRYRSMSSSSVPA